MQQLELSKEWFAGSDLLTGASASTPEGRAYAVTLWLRRVAGIRLTKMVAGDLGRLPAPQYVTELVATEVRKIRRQGGSSQEFERRLNAKISTALHKLPEPARAAFSAWPSPANPHSPSASWPVASGSRVADFERQVRKSVADGLLPASLLATAMNPADSADPAVPSDASRAVPRLASRGTAES